MSIVSYTNKNSAPRVYGFGERLKICVYESSAGLSWDPVPTSATVRLDMDFPMFPDPEGSECTSNPERLLDFVFGDAPQNHPLLQGIKIEITAHEKNDEVYGGHIFNFACHEKASCSQEQTIAAANLLYDYIRERVQCIRNGLQSEYDRSHEQAKHDNPLLSKLGLKTGHMTNSRWLREYPSESIQKEDIQKKAFPYLAKMRNVRFDVFEPVPGRPGRDAYGQPIGPATHSERERLIG